MKVSFNDQMRDDKFQKFEIYGPTENHFCSALLPGDPSNLHPLRVTTSPSKMVKHNGTYIIMNLKGKTVIDMSPTPDAYGDFKGE